MNQQPQATCFITMDSKDPYINEPKNPSCFFSSILSYGKNSNLVNSRLFKPVEVSSQCIMVDVCKNVADNLLKHNIELDDIDQNLIDHKVIELSDMSEPGMLLLIGIYDHLSNFSPWHIRLSEIIKIPSYKLVNHVSIRDAIIRYNKIEKRFGK
ncbi:dehydrodolichyl diphosphate syntase complex subunit NUS1 [Brachionus plicatilis]|uniref:ditrans,polycis-polyprenyl diphosphate synthase [(2E,6E)-farnesyldiphosphate specific] n=1 Tax=Brachionus plicatilis TaxID=10195 RepID=A0A3M7T3Y9_BRAPC|nr:dehydrodolichyl diphosphate syntase complex subunit NUS1 [Brachionus plicatilis]